MTKTKVFKIKKTFRYLGRKFEIIPRKNLPSNLKKVEKKSLKIVKKLFNINTKKIKILYVESLDEKNHIAEYVINSSKDVPTYFIFWNKLYECENIDYELANCIIHESLHHFVEKNLSGTFTHVEEENWVEKTSKKICQKYF